MSSIGLPRLSYHEEGNITRRFEVLNSKGNVLARNRTRLIIYFSSIR